MGANGQEPGAGATDGPARGPADATECEAMGRGPLGHSAIPPQRSAYPTSD